MNDPGFTQFMTFKALLYAHRRDALTCYDHPEDYCCVCGEHQVLGYVEHLAAVLAKYTLEELSGVFEEGRTAGKEHEKAVRYWQDRDMPGLVTMGKPAARPERPKNPYLKKVDE